MGRSLKKVKFSIKNFYTKIYKNLENFYFYSTQAYLMNFFFSGVFCQVNLKTTSVGCLFPLTIGPITNPNTNANKFCTNEGFTNLPDNSLWAVLFFGGLNTGPDRYLNNPADQSDLGYLTYVSANNQNGVEQTAFTSPLLDVSGVGTFDVNFHYVLNGQDVGSLCKF